MCLDRFLRDEKLLSQAPVGESTSQPGEHLAFTRRQTVQLGEISRLPGNGRHHRRCCFRCKERVAPMYGTDRLLEFAGIGVLEQVSVCASLNRWDHLLLGGEAGQHQDPSGRPTAAKAADNLDPVKFRHLEIEQ